MLLHLSISCILQWCVSMPHSRPVQFPPTHTLAKAHQSLCLPHLPLPPTSNHFLPNAQHTPCLTLRSFPEQHYTPVPVLYLFFPSPLIHTKPPVPLPALSVTQSPQLSYQLNLRNRSLFLFEYNIVQLRATLRLGQSPSHQSTTLTFA